MSLKYTLEREFSKEKLLTLDIPRPHSMLPKDSTAATTRKQPPSVPDEKKIQR